MSAGTALVTGASSGIGLEIARLLAAEGYDLVVVARREDALRRLAEDLGARHGVTVRVVPADLAAPDAADRVFRDAGGGAEAPDVLVNNAGFGLVGPYAGADPVEEMAMLRVNLVAPTRLVRLFLPGMVARGSGRILNVASTAAFQPGPFMTLYYATKAYLLSFSEALAEELRGTGVTVTCLCPGPVITEFQERARVEGRRLLKAPLVMDARAVARAGVRGTLRGKRLVIPGALNRLGVLAVRLAPRAFVLRVVRGLNASVSGRAGRRVGRA